MFIVVHFSTNLCVVVEIKDIHIYQWRITPAIIKKFAMTYITTIIVLRQAMMSASLSLLPDFSPSALAQSLQINLSPSLLIQMCQ